MGRAERDGRSLYGVEYCEKVIEIGLVLYGTEEIVDLRALLPYQDSRLMKRATALMVL